LALAAAAVSGREFGKGVGAARLVGLALVTLGISISSASQLAGSNYKEGRGYRFGFMLFSIGMLIVITNR